VDPVASVGTNPAVDTFLPSALLSPKSAPVQPGFPVVVVEAAAGVRGLVRVFGASCT